MEKEWTRFSKKEYKSLLDQIMLYYHQINGFHLLHLRHLMETQLVRCRIKLI